MPSKAALLIIDLQRISFTEETPRYDTEGTVDRVNQLAASCRAKGHPVVVIQHDGTAQDMCIPETEEWKLLEGLELQEQDLYVSKTANDCFHLSNLQQVLDEHEVTHLLITGCATDFCVEATIQRAVTKDYHITVVADGHTTADRPSITAKQVIDHYNWVWQHMIPTKGSLKVKTTQELLQQLD